jgi:hypothetical protein
MRRIALLGALATSLLIAGAAQAQHHGEPQKSATVQLHNQTSHELMVVAEHAQGRISHNLMIPHGYVVLQEVKDKSCVRVHLRDVKDVFDGCLNTPSRIGVACNFPDKFVCVYHQGSDEKDLLVTIRPSRSR